MLLAQANLGICYAKRDDDHRAAEVNARTLAQARELGYNFVQVGVATRLANNLVDLGRPQEALDVLEDNPDAQPDQENVLEPARRSVIRARSLHALGRSEQAAQEARDLVESLSTTSLHAVQAEALEVLSDTELAAGHQSAGERHRAQAIALFLAVGQDEPARRLSRVFLHSDVQE